MRIMIYDIVNWCQITNMPVFINDQNKKGKFTSIMRVCCVRFRNYAIERREKEEKKKGKKRSGLDRNVNASFVWSAILSEIQMWCYVMCKELTPPGPYIGKKLLSTVASIRYIVSHIFWFWTYARQMARVITSVLQWSMWQLLLFWSSFMQFISFF